MSLQSKSTVLKSKLAVFLVCYQKAEERRDQERMDKLEPFISDLREEIHHLESAPPVFADGRNN